MPNKENIRKWVKDLRSGSYKQTDGGLHRDGAYCCLGVACETYRKNVSKISHSKFWQSYDDDVYLGFKGENSELPKSVAEWLGFDDSEPDVNIEEEFNGAKHNTRRSLILLNDIDRKNFIDIAELIENTYLKENTDAQ